MERSVLIFPLDGSLKITSYGAFLFLKKLAYVWKRRKGRGDEEKEGGGEWRVALVSFFGHKALPSDTCHWLGTGSLSAWQEVKASGQKLKGWVYANTHSQRKRVPLVSVWRPDKNGTCFPHRHPFRGKQAQDASPHMNVLIGYLESETTAAFGVWIFVRN